jgi:hypothetical protein
LCDHDYFRCGGHTLDDTNTPTVLGSPASLIGSEFPVYLAPALRFAPPSRTRCRL